MLNKSGVISRNQLVQSIFIPLCVIGGLVTLVTGASLVYGSGMKFRFTLEPRHMAWIVSGVLLVWWLLGLGLIRSASGKTRATHEKSNGSFIVSVIPALVGGAGLAWYLNSAFFDVGAGFLAMTICLGLVLSSPAQGGAVRILGWLEIILAVCLLWFTEKQGGMGMFRGEILACLLMAILWGAVPLAFGLVTGIYRFLMNR